jgi:hypothetical protein
MIYYKYYFLNLKINYNTNINSLNNKTLIFILFFGDWGLGIGDWGLGIGDWGLGPIPNPHV